MKHYVSRMERMLKNKEPTEVVPLSKEQADKINKSVTKRQMRMDKRKKGQTEKNGEIS